MSSLPEWTWKCCYFPYKLLALSSPHTPEIQKQKRDYRGRINSEYPSARQINNGNNSRLAISNPYFHVQALNWQKYSRNSIEYHLTCRRNHFTSSTFLPWKTTMRKEATHKLQILSGKIWSSFAIYKKQCEL